MLNSGPCLTSIWIELRLFIFRAREKFPEPAKTSRKTRPCSAERSAARRAVLSRRRIVALVGTPSGAKPTESRRFEGPGGHAFRIAARWSFVSRSRVLGFSEVTWSWLPCRGRYRRDGNCAARSRGCRPRVPLCRWLSVAGRVVVGSPRLLASPHTAEEVEKFLVPDVPSPSERRTLKAGLTFALRVTEADSTGGRTHRRAGNLVVRDSEVPTN